MISVFAFMATLCAALFTGASLYINFVEHPARVSCGTALAVTEFAPSYKRATVMQVLLAIISFLAALLAWLWEAGVYWLIGGVLIFLVIPFTAVVILPTNKQLLNPSLDKNSDHAQQLLNRWGKLHVVRSVLSLASLIVFLYALIWT